MGILGIILQLKYKLGNHYFMGFRMDVWGLILLACASIVLRFTGQPVWSTVLALVAILDGILVIWAKKIGYVFFTPEAAGEGMPAEYLQPDEVVPVKAFGCFRIRDQVRYLAHHPIIYTTVKSREHIMIAQLEQKRFLLLGVTAEEDWGCWYQFVKPEEIDQVQTGRVYHGWRSWPGIRVLHRFENDEGKVEFVKTIFSFENEQKRSLVLKDLNREFAE